MTRKSYKTVLRLKGIRPVKIERTVKRDGDVELLPVRGSIVHGKPTPMAELINFGREQERRQLEAFFSVPLKEVTK